MSKRSEIIEAYIRQSEWRAWTRIPIAGDASSRRYERLTNSDQSVILMDDPDKKTDKFAEIAFELHRLQLHPPTILEHTPELGIMVLSDLGKDDFASWLNKKPTEAPDLYKSASDILLHLQGKDICADLAKLTPSIGGEMVAVTADFYLGKPAPELCFAVKQSLAEHASMPDTLSLRDFHAENLIWRPAKSGFAKVGLLDFQDAFLAPSGYDLISLLRDVRRDVAPNLVEEIILYFAEWVKNESEFRTQLACLGVQRNLRILGGLSFLASKA